MHAILADDRASPKVRAMNRDEILATLRAHEPELKSAGIVRLAVFGSVARDQAGPGSDIDLLAAFDDTHALSLLDVIGA